MESFGKFCHNTDEDSHKEITGSGNIGHGLCCKPDYNGEECTTNLIKKQVCSQPAIDGNPTYYDILTDEHVNH